MTFPKCNCESCSFHADIMCWTCRGALGQTMGGQWKFCPFCGSPLPDYAACLRDIGKAAGQVAEALTKFAQKMMSHTQKVYEAAKAQGLLDDKEDEDDVD